MPVRVIAFRLPEVTSAKTSRSYTPAAARASTCSCASCAEVLTLVYPKSLTQPF